MKKAILLLGILFLAGAGHVLAGKNQAETERYAFVTNEGDNNLIVVDLNTEKTVRVLPTGKAPHALAFTNKGKGYVNNRGSKDLTVIDGNRFEVITTIPLSATSFQLALSPDGKTLAVAYKDALKVSLIDTSTDSVIKTISIGREPEWAFKGAMMRHPYWSRDPQSRRSNVSCHRRSLPAPPRIYPGEFPARPYWAPPLAFRTLPVCQTRST